MRLPISIRRSRGFTMVELVVAMVLSSIVVGFISMMIATPLQSYMAQSRRADLNDSAETAMRAMSADIRKALPNSVRTGMDGANVVLEMIDVMHVVNYHAWTTGDVLTTHVADDGFDAVTLVPIDIATPQLVVGNRRAWADSAYRTDGGDGVITPSSTRIDLNPARTRFSISPPFTFTQDSPRSRAYIVSGADGVTRFECNMATGELRRYGGLPITDSIGPLAAPFAVIARDISACSFRGTDGTMQHGGIVIIEITFSRTAEGNVENLRMLRQVRVENPS